MKKAVKAYNNRVFLNSSEARILRILAEYLEPEKRFHESNLKHTVVFFGSARITPKKKDRYNTRQFYRDAEELAYLLGKFSRELEEEEKFAICTGGGPGIMEAANKGAGRAKIPSVGLNISLPLEQSANPYVDENFNFEFHYFFMRKLWFLYHAKAIIYFPGGFGTLDELFETLTLIQTGKFEKHNIPIFLYQEDFWRDLIDFDKLVQYGLISPHDQDTLHFFSGPREGFEKLKPLLLKSIREFNTKKNI